MGKQISFVSVMRKTLSSLLAVLMILDLGPLNSRLSYAQSLPTQALGNAQADIFATLDQPALQVNMRQGKSFEGKQGIQLILIRDLHVQEEAQEKIAMSLQQIYKATGIHKVFLEGAEGKISSVLYQAFPHSDIRRKVAREFVKEGYLTGAELAAIDLGLENSIELYGVEDTQTYLQNLKAFRESRNLTQEFSAEIGEIDQRIQKAKEKLFSPTLLNLDKMRQDLRGKNPDLQKILGGAEQILNQRNTPSLERWQNLKNMNEIITLTKSVDQNLIHKELGQLIEGLEKSLSKEDLKEVVSKTLQFRLGRIETSHFLENLREIYLKHGGTESSFHEKYTHLEDWQLLASKQESLNMDLVWKELDQLISELTGEYAAQEKMQEWVDLGEEWTIIKKLLALELTRQELETVKSWKLSEKISGLSGKLSDVKNGSENLPNIRLFENLNSALDTAVHFYRLAESRDAILVSKTLGYFSGKNDAGVLITGGFHTEGIQRLLEEKGISYITWTPKVSQLKGSRYEEIMMDSHYNLDNIDFSDKRLAWHAESSEVMKMLSTPVLLGQVLASINPKGYDALKVRLLEEMIEGGKKEDARSINAILEDWIQKADISVLNFLRNEDLNRLIRVIGSMYPQEVFIDLAKMESSDPDAGKLAIRVVARAYQKKYPALVALTKAYFKILKDQKQTLEKSKVLADQVLENERDQNIPLMVQNSLEAAKLWGKFARKYPNDSDARARVLSILSAVTLPSVLDLYPEGNQAFQSAHRLLVRIQKVVPEAAEIQEAMVKNGVNEILYAFSKAEASMTTAPRESSEALEKLKRKIDRFMSAREADLKIYPKYSETLENLRRKAEFNILRADLKALLADAGRPESAEAVAKGIKSFLAKANYLAKTYPLEDDIARILSQISTNPKFQEPVLASLRDPALRIQNDWVHQYFESEFALFLNMLRLPKDFISYLEVVSSKEPSTLNMIDFAMFLMDEHEKPLRQSSLSNIDGGLAVRALAENNYSFYALAKWAEVNPDKAKEVFGNMIEKEIPAEEAPAAVEAPGILDSEGFLPDDQVIDLIEAPVAVKAPPIPQRALPPSLQEMGVIAMMDRARVLLTAGDLLATAKVLEKVDEEIEKDPRIIAVMKDFYRKIVDELDRLWKQAQSKLDPESELSAMQNLARIPAKVPFEADDYVDLNFEFVILKTKIDHLAKAQAAYQAGLKYAQNGFIESAQAELAKIKQFMSSVHVMYTDLASVIEKERTAAVEGQIEVILSQADQALERGLGKDDWGEIRNAMKLWENAVRLISENKLDAEKHQQEALQQKRNIFQLFLRGMSEMTEGKREEAAATLSEAGKQANELFQKDFLREKAFDAVLHKQVKALLEWAMDNLRTGLEAETAGTVQKAVELYDEALMLMHRNIFEFAQVEDSWVERDLIDDQKTAMEIIVKAFSLSDDDARDAFQEAYQASKAFDQADRRRIEKLVVAYRLPRMLEAAENLTREAIQNDSAGKADAAFQQYQSIQELAALHQLSVIRARSGTLTVTELKNRFEMAKVLKEGYEKEDGEVLRKAQHFALHAGLSKDDLDLVLQETDRDFLKDGDIEVIHPFDEITRFAAIIDEKEESRDKQFTEVVAELFKFVTSKERGTEALVELSLIFDYWLDASYLAFLSGNPHKSRSYARNSELILRGLSFYPNLKPFAAKLSEDQNRLTQRMAEENRTLKPVDKTNLIVHQRAVMYLKARFANKNNQESFQEGEEFLKQAEALVAGFMESRDFTQARKLVEFSRDFVTAMKKFVPGLTESQEDLLKKYDSDFSRLESLTEDAANLEVDAAKIENQIEAYGWSQDESLLEPSAVTAAAILNSALLARLPEQVRQNLTERTAFVLFQAVASAKERADAAMARVSMELKSGGYAAAGMELRTAEKWIAKGIMYRDLVSNLGELLRGDLKDHIQTIEISRDYLAASLEQMLELAIRDAKTHEAAFVASAFQDTEALAGLNNAFHTAVSAYIRLTMMDEKYNVMGRKVYAPFYDLMIHLQGFAGVSEETGTGARVEVAQTDSTAYLKGKELADDVLNILSSSAFLPEWNWVGEDHFVFREMTSVMNFFLLQRRLTGERKELLNRIELAVLNLAEILDIRKLPNTETTDNIGEYIRDIEDGIKDDAMSRFAWDRLVDFLISFTNLSQQLLHQGHVAAAQKYFSYIGTLITHFEHHYFISIVDSERQERWQEMRNIFALRARGMLLIEGDKLQDALTQYREAAGEKDFNTAALESSIEDLVWFSAYYQFFESEDVERTARSVAIALRDIFAEKIKSLKVTDADLIQKLAEAEKNLRLVESLQKEWADINGVIDRYAAEGLIGPQESLVSERLAYMMGFPELKDDARSSFTYFIHLLTKKAEQFLAKEEPGVDKPAEEAYELALVALRRMRSNASETEAVEIDKQIAAIEKAVSEIIPFENVELIEEEQISFNLVPSQAPFPLVTQAAEPFQLLVLAGEDVDLSELEGEDEITQRRKVEDVLTSAFREYPASANFINGVAADFAKAAGLLHTLNIVADEKNPVLLSTSLSNLSKPFLERVLPEIEKQIQTTLAANNDGEVERLLLLAFRLNDAMTGIYERHGFDQLDSVGVFKGSNSKLLKEVLNIYAQKKIEAAAALEPQHAKNIYGRLLQLYQAVVQNINAAEFDETLIKLKDLHVLFNNPEGGADILELRKIVAEVRENIAILEKGLSARPGPDPLGVSGTLLEAHERLSKALDLITKLDGMGVQSAEFSDARRNWMVPNRRVENLLRETGNALLDKAKAALGRENLEEAGQILDVSRKIVAALQDQDEMASTQKRLETLTGVAKQVPDVAFRHLDPADFDQLNSRQIKTFYENAVSVLKAVRNISDVAGPNNAYLDIVRKAALFVHFYGEELAKRKEYEEAALIFNQLIALLEGLQKMKYAAKSFNDIYVDLRGRLESDVMAAEFEMAKLDLEKGEVTEGRNKLRRIVENAEGIIAKYDPAEKLFADALKDTESNARVLLVKLKIALADLNIYPVGYKGRLQAVEQDEDLFKLAGTFKDAFLILRRTGRQPLIDVLNELRRRAHEAHEYGNPKTAAGIFEAIRDTSKDIQTLDRRIAAFYQESMQYLSSSDPVLALQSVQILDAADELEELTEDDVIHLDEQGQDIIPLRNVIRRGGNFAVTSRGQASDDLNLTNQGVNFAIRRDLGKARLLPNQIRLAGEVVSIKPGEIQGEVAKARPENIPVDDILNQLQNFLSSPAYLALDAETRKAFETTRLVIINGKVSLAEDPAKGISYAHYGEGYGTPSVFFGGLLVRNLLKNDPASFAALIRIEMNRKLYREKNKKDKKDTRTTLQVVKDADISEAVLGQLIQSISKIEFENLTVPDDFFDSFEAAVVEDVPSSVFDLTKPGSTDHFALTPEGNIANRQGICGTDVNEIVKARMDAAKIEPDQTLLQGDILSVKASQLRDLTGAAVDGLLGKLVNFIQSPDYQGLDPSVRLAFEGVRIVIFKNSLSVARNDRGISYAHYGEANQVPTVFLGGDLLEKLLDGDTKSLATLLRLEMNRRLYRQQNAEDLRGSREVVQDSKVTQDELERLQGVIIDAEVEALLKLKEVTEAVQKGSKTADLLSAAGTLFEKAKGLFLDKLVEALGARLEAKEAGTLKGAVSSIVEERGQSDAAILTKNLLKVLGDYPRAQAVGLNRLTGDVVVYLGGGRSQVLPLPDDTSQILQNVLGRQNFGQDYIVMDLVKNLDSNSRDTFVGASISSLIKGLGALSQSDNVALHKSEDFVLLSQRGPEAEPQDIEPGIFNAFQFFEAQFFKQDNPVAIEANLLRSLPADELKLFIQQYGRRLALQEGEEIQGLSKEELRQLWKNWSRYAAIQDPNFKVAILAKDSEASVDMRGGSFLRIDAGQVSALGYVTKFGAYVADVGKEKAKMDPVANQMLREVLKVLYSEGQIPAEILEETPFEKILENPEGFLFPPVKVNTVSSEIESLLRAKSTVEAMA